MAEPFAGAWRHLGVLAAAGAGEGFGAWRWPRYPEGPCRVASPRASMRQCADAHSERERAPMGKKKSYQAWTQDQMFLMPPSMREWLKEDHLAWFILDVVSELEKGVDAFACN